MSGIEITIVIVGCLSGLWVFGSTMSIFNARNAIEGAVALCITAAAFLLYTAAIIIVGKGVIF